MNTCVCNIFWLLETPVHAKLLQFCLTLCNPVDCRQPGSSIHGILQARILEWVAVWKHVLIYTLCVPNRREQSGLEGGVLCLHQPPWFTGSIDSHCGCVVVFILVMAIPIIQVRRVKRGDGMARDWEGGVWAQVPSGAYFHETLDQLCNLLELRFLPSNGSNHYSLRSYLED